VRRLWPEILERLKKRRVVWSLMQNATPREVNGSELILVVQHQGLVRRFADDQVVKLVQEALNEVLGVRWAIRAVADGAPVQAPARPAEPQRRATPPGDSGGDDWPEVRQVAKAPEPEEDPGPPPPPEYDGFDPGDEPMDEPEGQGGPIRRDTEAEALALLEQTLGARKIGGR
jgi:DNA polymerase-3 subunit gamma/tau